MSAWSRVCEQVGTSDADLGGLREWGGIEQHARLPREKQRGKVPLIAVGLHLRHMEPIVDLRLRGDGVHDSVGVTYIALHEHMPWTDYVYDWQPFLKRGIEAGLFAAGTLSADLAAALLDEGSPTPGVR